MAGNVEIFFSSKDELSKSLKNMSDSAVRSKKDLKELSDEVAKLNNKKIDDVFKLDKARKELQETKKNAKALGDEFENTFKKKQAEVQKLEQVLKGTNSAIKENERSVRSFNSVANGKGGTGVNSNGMLGTLAGAGLFKMAGSALNDLAGAGLGSMFGSNSLATNGVTNIAGGMAAGAALGSIIPGLGTAVGAGIGALTGVVQTVTQEFTKADEKFRGITGETYNNLSTYYNGMATRGTVTAGQRERDKLGFDTLLKGDSTNFMNELIGFASKTPFAYGDLTTMSKSALTGFGADSVFNVLRSVGDAGSALNLDSGSMNYMTQVLSRMNNSNKFTLENFNAFNERGVNIGSYLADAYGKSIGEVYEMISKGAIKGQDAVKIVLANLDKDFGGSMAKMSETFDGLMSTYQDSLTNLDAIAGEAYNQGRKEQIKKNTTLNESNVLEDMAEYKGAYQAQLENMQDEYRNKAIKELERTADYQKATAEEKGRMVMEAETKAKMDYMQTPEYKSWADAQISDYKGVAETIADYGQQKYYDIGQMMAAEQSKGYAAYFENKKVEEMIDATVPSYINSYNNTKTPTSSYMNGGGYAYGLSYVPSNGVYKLHEGERVLTASESRAYSNKGTTSGITINMNGTIIREEADVKKIANELSRQIKTARINIAM